MMKIWQEYKPFIIGSGIFLLLIFYVLFSADKTEEELSFSSERYKEKQKIDKASELQKVYQEEEEEKEKRSSFLSATEKMAGVVDIVYEGAPEKQVIKEDNSVIEFAENPKTEEIKPKPVVAKKAQKKVVEEQPKKQVKEEELANEEEYYWVSVSERKAQRSKKSAKVGYKSAYIQTLGEKIKDGDKISIIIDEPIAIGEEIFPADSELFGTINFQKKRGIIKITRILKDSKAMNCNIDAYDMDGYLGIALDIDIEQEIGSDVVDEGIQQAASYGSQASRIAASMAGAAAKKIKNEPYVRIENKRKIYLSVN